MDTQSTAAHLEEARKRGRGLLADEAAFQVPEELQQAALAARDGIVVVALLWSVLAGAGIVEHAAHILVSAAAAYAIFTGVFNALTVAGQLRFWTDELRRERDEIREHPELEREEVRALYEAKGFSGEVLDQIVDTLCADEDRLLKLMLEEELGIFFERQQHPVIVGGVTGLASCLAGVSLALLATTAHPVIAGGVALLLLLVLAFLRTGVLRVGTLEVWARWTLAAGFVAGAGYLLADLLGGDMA
jgi:VIT1/CCC1 family predicted Fe2+/Mn2+ transporter